MSNKVKMRKIGTQISYYLDRFYTDGKTEYVHDDFNSTQTFNQTIEVLLALGLVNSEEKKEFSTKSELKNYRFKKIDQSSIELPKLFIEKYIEKPCKDSDQLKKCMLLAIYFYDSQNNCVYENKKTELAEHFLEFGENGVKELKDMYIDKLNTLEIRTLIEREFKANVKYEWKPMSEQYNVKRRKQVVQKDSYEQYLSTIVYSAGELIEDLNNSIDYIIPIYQRNYVWDKKSIHGLLESIMNNEIVNLNNATFKRVQRVKKQENKIIDGQQRITSIYLIFTALYRRLNNMFSEYYENLDEDMQELMEITNAINYEYIDENNSVRHSFMRIEGNYDYSAFNKLLSNESLEHNERGSRIYENYNYIYEFLTCLNTKELIKFTNKFLNNVFLIVTIDTLSDEFNLFEKLNTTSVPLTTIDLIKSYLLSLLNLEEVDKRERDYQKLFENEITAQVEEASKKVDIDKFLRIYLRMNNYQISNNSSLLEIYKRLVSKKYVSITYKEIEKELKHLGEVLELYIYITGKNPKKALSVYADLKIDDFIITLGSREIYSPFIIKLMLDYKANIYTSNEVRELLFEIEKFEIIFKICKYRGQSLSTALDVFYNNLTFDERKISKQMVVNELNNQEVFKSTLNTSKNDFKETIMKFEFKTDTSKIVLTRIVNYLDNRNKIILNESDDLFIHKDATVEHIMPKKGDKWITNKDVTSEEHQLNVERLGNHLLLNKKINSEASNKRFKDKIEVIEKTTHMARDLTFSKNQDEIGFDIRKLNKFDAKTIEKRTKYLAELAVEIWKG